MMMYLSRISTLSPFLLLTLCLSTGSNLVVAKDITVSICDDGLSKPCSIREEGTTTLERSALIHLPNTNTKGVQIPLVINLHALGANPEFQQELSQFDKIADKEGFIVAYPQGKAPVRSIISVYGWDRIRNALLRLLPGSGQFSWNAGGCCGAASEEDPPIDEIKFFRELIKYIQNDLSKSEGFTLDMERIYVTGMSNGGFMTHRVACEMSDIVAAVAPVAGPMMDNRYEGTGLGYQIDENFECKPENPIPILHIHGKNDLVVPFTGSKVFGFPSVLESINFWRENNGVKKENPEITEYFGTSSDARIPFWISIWTPILTSSTTCQQFNDPDGTKERTAVVELCEHDSRRAAGHCWPSKENFFGACLNGVGSEYIWEFFKKHKRPSSSITEEL